MNNIIQYELLWSWTGPSCLSKQVNVKLKEGWVLYGSPIVNENNHYQAVVKYADDTDFHRTEIKKLPVIPQPSKQ